MESVIQRLHEEIKAYGSLGFVAPVRSKQGSRYNKNYSAKKPRDCKIAVEFCDECTETPDCTYKDQYEK